MISQGEPPAGRNESIGCVLVSQQPTLCRFLRRALSISSPIALAWASALDEFAWPAGNGSPFSHCETTARTSSNIPGLSRHRV
jgi:hypothetical protein